MEIAGQVAVVTGAAAGIGRATAKRLAREGAHVVVADTDGEWGREAVEEISRAFGISRHHLVKVVQMLTDLGVVEAQRGRGGG